MPDSGWAPAVRARPPPAPPTRPAVCVPAGATYDIVIPADPGVLAVRIKLN
jgi:hypothetical protein